MVTWFSFSSKGSFLTVGLYSVLRQSHIFCTSPLHTSLRPLLRRPFPKESVRRGLSPKSSMVIVSGRPPSLTQCCPVPTLVRSPTPFKVPHYLKMKKQRGSRSRHLGDPSCLNIEPSLVTSHIEKTSNQTTTIRLRVLYCDRNVFRVHVGDSSVYT